MGVKYPKYGLFDFENIIIAEVQWILYIAMITGSKCPATMFFNSENVFTAVWDQCFPR